MKIARIIPSTASAGLLALILGTSLWAPVGRVIAAEPPSAPPSAPPPVPAPAPPPLTMDPRTGLPVPQVTWIDPSWKAPSKMLSEVNYDGLPLSEIARQLVQEFKGEFDVLLPRGWQDPNSPNVSVDPPSASMTMRLKNVTLPEIFNAMNLVFEAENTPYRWELKMNGNRPIAMLRVLPQLLPVPQPPEPPAVNPTTRMVYFVGDMVDDSGGMERLVKTISEVFRMSYGEAKGVLQFHKDAQLLIVTGTKDQISFVQQTLSALRGKAQAEKQSAARLEERKARGEEKKTAPQ
jgi:hypothetical protein